MTYAFDGRTSQFMKQLVNNNSGQVRFRTLIETHEFLVRNGFVLGWKKEWGPKGGWMLLYHGGGFRATSRGLVVRIKTHGDKAGQPRAFRPHLSVVWQEGVSVEDEEGRDRDFQDHERAKFDLNGGKQSKLPTGTKEEADKWGDLTHPMFPGFEASSERNPLGLYGADTIQEGVGIA